MLLRKSFKMEGLGVIEVEEEEEEEEGVEEGEEGEEEEEAGERSWGVWILLGGRSVRAVGESMGESKG